MLSDSKIMTKTSVGRVGKVGIMRYNLARESCPCIYVRGTVSVRMTLSDRDEKRVGLYTVRVNDIGGGEDHVNDVHSDPTLRVLCATENTAIASYRGTCVEMCAYYSSATVSRFPHLSPNVVVG